MPPTGKTSVVRGGALFVQEPHFFSDKGYRFLLRSQTRTLRPRDEGWSENASVRPSMQALLAACGGFLLTPLSLGPARPPCRLAVGMQAESEEPLDLSKLRSRIQKIQSEGLSTPTQMLFELATEKAPAEVMREFFTTASPQVTEAMQDDVMSLLGSLPPLQFDASVTTTGDRLAALMLQLQMTGYMLRNAEYVFTLRRILDIKSRSIDEYRAAFERIDTDGSGYIEPPEVRVGLL